MIERKSRKRSKSLSLSEKLLRKLNERLLEENKKAILMDQQPISLSELVEKLLWKSLEK